MRWTYLFLATALACGGSEKTAADEPAAEPIDIGDERGGYRASAPPDVENDDDGLQVEGLRGRLDPHDIDRGVQPASADIARCFSSQSRRKRFLGGHVELAFVVARDGSVKKVQIARSDLGAWPVEKCLLETAAAMQFPEPEGGKAAEFSLPLDFPARRRVHWLSDEQGETEVAELEAELRECEPRPRDVTVTLYVGVRGKVKEVGFSSAAKRPIDPAWADCAAETILAWELSDPRGKIVKLAFSYR